MEFQINQATTPEDKQKCMQVRRIVFCDEQGYSPEIDLTPQGLKDDQECSHFLATSSTGEAVGNVRIHNTNGQLGRLAVLGPYRGSGLAKALCEAAHACAMAKGLKEIIADSQAEAPRDARGFYSKLGYVPRGDVMIKEGVQHQVMVLSL